ncbi:hypothetical protein, partial [Stenotrophomonas pictorum]|uniref:hypothetical protein n=1 Tax=Stenotrophomonas pictorum TaxID=86184 RepID=UPI0019D6ED03
MTSHAAVEGPFFACAKKSNQKRRLSNNWMVGQAHPGRMPALCVGSPLPDAFFDGTSGNPPIN